MSEYFSKIEKIKFEGIESSNPLSFKYYDENKIVLGKPMRDHLRFATAYWHSFANVPTDPFGGPTFVRPWKKSGDPMKMAALQLEEAFSFITKITTPFFCFHDRDISPEGETYSETQKNFFHIVFMNILFLFAKFIHFFLSKKMFCLAFNITPLILTLLQSFNVSKPIVGKSARRSCFFLGNLISIP